MASVITSPQYDPIPTAEKLATKAVAGQKAALAAQTALANNTSTALGNMKSAISTFQSAMSAMTSSKSVLSQSATFPAAGYGTATACINATPGTYSFFVEKLATASQMSYAGLTATPTPVAGTSTLKIKIGASDSFDVDLSTADKDGKDGLSPQEIAAAINGNSKNNSRVTASIVTINSTAQLVLTSNLTGLENAATLDASNVGDTDLAAALNTNSPKYKEVVKASDATVWLGGKPDGTAITQASNTFTNVQDVKITFTRAMMVSEAPVLLTVATDSTGTAANVQAFVDAYNKLKTLIDGLASPGNPEKNVAAGIFAHDSGLNALRSSMGNALRLSIGGDSLVSYGITAQRDGSISLNAAKLTAKLATNPTGLDQLFGNNSLSAPAGVLGSLDKVLGQWSNITKGQIMQRQAATDKLQKSLVKSGERLTAQYDTAYKRFLDQFSRLQVMQEQMSKTSDMFDAMFSNNKS